MSNSSVLVQDTIFNTAHIARVSFKENDPSIDHDDRCSIVFAGAENAPVEIYGEDARSAYEAIAAAMSVSL